jgi:hypothetical protein
MARKGSPASQVHLPEALQGMMELLLLLVAME